VSIFRNAIMESDNVNVNVGYLSLFWIMVVVLTVIPIMVVAAIVQAYYDEHHVFPFLTLGQGAGLITAAFASALTALGVFLWGDRRPLPPPPPGVTTLTTGPAPGQITATAVAPAPAATGAAEVAQYHAS